MFTIPYSLWCLFSSVYICVCFIKSLYEATEPNLLEYDTSVRVKYAWECRALWWQKKGDWPKKHLVNWTETYWTLTVCEKVNKESIIRQGNSTKLRERFKVIVISRGAGFLNYFRFCIMFSKYPSLPQGTCGAQH